MNLADLSIRRPTFVVCIVLVMLVVGLLSMSRLPVDLFPDITFPVVTVTTSYPGAGPSEIETLVSKPLEDEIGTLSGIKRLTSYNREGVSQVIAEFTLETDIKYAEQQIRDRVGSTKRLLPLEIKEPVIRRIDPADQPVLVLALDADLPEGKLFDLADDFIKPKLGQVSQVGLVEVIGGRKREIHVKLDRDKLKRRELSVTSVAGKLASAGQNVPVGKIEKGTGETVFRTMGEFGSIDQIKGTIVNFFGGEVPTTIADVGTVEDSLEDEASRAYINGKKSLYVFAYKQSGSNTIRVVDDLKKAVTKLNADLTKADGHPKLSYVRDTSVWIRANVEDVKESILMGIVFAVIVVFFFLGSGRSTIITGLALPNSLIGAFVLMSVAGFSINIMSLLALSLSVGLLIDDAIVVRENIFRHIEMGKDPKTASIEGTAEVRLAVIATTLTVISVFGPVGFLQGVVGQFFKQFGLTICFAMAISLFDALTIAPMLSTYFAGAPHGSEDPRSLWGMTIGRLLRGFNAFQDGLERLYERLLRVVMRRPLATLAVSLVLFFLCSATLGKVPKTFLPPQDSGEFAVSLDMAPGTNISRMSEVALEVDKILRSNPEVEVSALTVGNASGEVNKADFYVHLVDAKKRQYNTIQMKDRIREQLKSYAELANPVVKDYDAVGGGQRPFNINLIGLDQKELDDSAAKLFAFARKHPGLKDVDISTRPGKPEFQVIADDRKAKLLGISTSQIGQELRGQIEGVTPAKFRELGREYDVRVRLQDDQRDLKEGFTKTYVPNLNQNLVHLADVAQGKETLGPATINRQDRGRFVQISGDITPGTGMGETMADIAKFLNDPANRPSSVRFAFVGQAENFQELGVNMMVAMGLGILFIFLVLASLYESFITPYTIMLALPLALCGSFVALAVSGQSLNIFSMIGVVMLLGVATKNSILLVDYANQLIAAGKSRSEAMIIAGKTRLRPILMTSMALIAGTIPIALGLNEASRQRTSMGFAIIGGLISSTLLTLVVVPAAFTYIDRFRLWSKSMMKRIFAPKAPTRAEALGGHGSPRASGNGRSRVETEEHAEAPVR